MTLFQPIAEPSNVNEAHMIETGRKGDRMATQHEPALIDTQRSFDHASWVTLGVIVLFFVLSLAGAAAQYVLPNDGCLVDMTNFDAPVFQACIGGWPTPLRPGDRLKLFAGMPAALDAVHIPMVLPPPG